MVDKETLERLCREHPVLAFAKASYQMELSPRLGRYIATVQSHAGAIPLTLTEFYQGYVHFAILDYIANHGKEYTDKWKDSEIRNVMLSLAQIAFCEKFRKLKMNDAILRKYFLSVPAKNIDATKCDLTHISFGLLVRDISSRSVNFKFRDGGIQDYFCAMFHCQECERKWKKRNSWRSFSDSAVELRSKHLDLPQSLKDSMNLLPATGGIWRMTFGLLGHDLGTCNFQAQLLMDIIQRSVYNVTMTSFDITSLCVDFIYESQNRAKLAEYMDDFTLNQTICFSNAIVTPSRVPYMLSALSFLLRCSKDMFGIYLCSFGVTGQNIQCLAHATGLEDTSLQVLNLSDNPLGDEGVKKLQGLLFKATSMTHLDLGNCDIGNEGMLYIAECTLNLPLLYLRLADNHIDDDGLRPLVRRMKYCGSMEMLDLSNNKLTDRSVVHLGQALHNLTNLRGLDLRGNAIGEAGLDAVSTSLSKSYKTLHVHEGDDGQADEGKSSSSDRKKNPLWQTKSMRKVGTSLNPKIAQGFLNLRRRTFARQRERAQSSEALEEPPRKPQLRHAHTDPNIRRRQLRFSNGSIPETSIE